MRSCESEQNCYVLFARSSISAVFMLLSQRYDGCGTLDNWRGVPGYEEFLISRDSICEQLGVLG